MPFHAANDLKPGLKFLLEKKPCTVLEAEFIKPGKGQAFARIRYRELTSGKVLERTFKSSEKVEGADVVELDVQYLYGDGDKAFFMHPDSYEQYEVPLDVAGEEACQWLVEQAICSVTIFDGTPIGVAPPNFVEMEVVETSPGVRGDTVTGGSKPAKLATGATVEVPLFIDKGEVLRIDTRTGEYVGRVRN